MSKKSIDERLKAHPILQGRIEAILDIARVGRNSLSVLRR
jgi:hypothetical protein